MSASEGYAVRCGRDLDETTKRLIYFNELRDKLKIEVQSQSAEVAQGNMEAINTKIAAEEAMLGQRRQELEMALAALKAKPCASAAASGATASAASLDGKIPLATQQEAAYIEEGNQGKGQGMASTYELIDQIKASDEKTHENMVEFARFARETELHIRLYDAAISEMALNDPRRPEFEATRSHLQRSLASDLRMIEIGRLLLDGGAVIVESIEEGK